MDYSPGQNPAEWTVDPVTVCVSARHPSVLGLIGRLQKAALWPTGHDKELLTSLGLDSEQNDEAWNQAVPLTGSRALSPPTF